MASDAGFVEYLREQLALGERFSWRRMFGEYAMYVDGKVVGFVCDNRVLIKPNAAVARLHPQLPQRPPYPGAKDYPVADELLDYADALRRVFLESAAVLPAAKPKTPKPKTPKPTKPKPAPRRKRGDSG